MTEPDLAMGASLVGTICGFLGQRYGKVFLRHSQVFLLYCQQEGSRRWQIEPPQESVGRKWSRRKWSRQPSANGCEGPTWPYSRGYTKRGTPRVTPTRDWLGARTSSNTFGRGDFA